MFLIWTTVELWGFEEKELKFLDKNDGGSTVEWWDLGEEIEMFSY